MLFRPDAAQPLGLGLPPSERRLLLGLTASLPVEPRCLVWHSAHQELRPSRQRGLERNSEHSFTFPHLRQLFVIQAFSRCPSRKTGVGVVSRSPQKTNSRFLVVLASLAVVPTFDKRRGVAIRLALREHADRLCANIGKGLPLRLSRPASSGTGSPGQAPAALVIAGLSTHRLISPGGSGCVWLAVNARPRRAQTRRIRRRRRSARRSRAGPARRRA